MTSHGGIRTVNPAYHAEASRHRVADRVDCAGVEGFDAQERPGAVAPRLSESGMKRLDPEVLGAHLGPLLRAAWGLCGSRDGAEDLVQDTFAGILSRPRFLRGEDERAYLMQALRNTFVSNTRRAARRPRVVTTLERLDAADRRTAARPEEAVIAAQVFPAIAQLPESFRLALVAVDIAGLSYGEAARALGAPEATITTRLYRARRRVAHELDPERFGAAQPKGIGEACAHPADGATAASNRTTRSANTTRRAARAARPRDRREK
jgi:RNA polymerase sigma-70 factor, ECF subfamily